jgi:hypothetical protein
MSLRSPHPAQLPLFGAPVRPDPPEPAAIVADRSIPPAPPPTPRRARPPRNRAPHPPTYDAARTALAAVEAQVLAHLGPDLSDLAGLAPVLEQAAGHARAMGLFGIETQLQAALQALSTAVFDPARAHLALAALALLWTAVRNHPTPTPVLMEALGLLSADAVATGPTCIDQFLVLREEHRREGPTPIQRIFLRGRTSARDALLTLGPPSPKASAGCSLGSVHPGQVLHLELAFFESPFPLRARLIRRLDPPPEPGCLPLWPSPDLPPTTPWGPEQPEGLFERWARARALHPWLDALPTVLGPFAPGSVHLHPHPHLGGLPLRLGRTLAAWGASTQGPFTLAGTYDGHSLAVGLLASAEGLVLPGAPPPTRALALAALPPAFETVLCQHPEPTNRTLLGLALRERLQPPPRGPAPPSTGAQAPTGDPRPPVPAGLLPMLEAHPELLPVVHRAHPNGRLVGEAADLLPRLGHLPGFVALLPWSTETLRAEGLLPPDWQKARHPLLAEAEHFLPTALRCLRTGPQGILHLEAPVPPPRFGAPTPEGWSAPASAALAYLLAVPLEALFAAWGSPEALLTDAGPEMAPLAAAVALTASTPEHLALTVAFFARFPEAGLEPILSHLIAAEAASPPKLRQAQATSLLLAGELPRPSLCLSLPEGLPEEPTEIWLRQGAPHLPGRATGRALAASLPTVHLNLAIETIQARFDHEHGWPHRLDLSHLLRALKARIELGPFLSSPPAPPPNPFPAPLSHPPMVTQPTTDQELIAYQWAGLLPYLRL